MMRDYIEASGALRLVFPHLRRSPRKQDSWTLSELTVDRPPGIRDASVVSVGIDGAIDGARIAWAVVDDILNRENTSTEAGLKKVHEWFDSSVLTRLDKRNGRCVVTNTPWAREDLTHKLQNAGWPVLEMDIYGNVFIYNAPGFDSEDLRPSDQNAVGAEKDEELSHRLVAHDSPPYTPSEKGRDRLDQVPLWPERIGLDEIVKIKEKQLPHRFAQMFLMRVRDDDTARCQQAWIHKCTRRGLGFVSRYGGNPEEVNPVVCGVDLGVGLDKKSGSTVFFVAELQLAEGTRRVLYVDSGRWSVDKIKQRFLEIHHAYHPVFRVENNAAQQWMVDCIKGAKLGIPVRAHTTGRSKAHPDLGVESVFLELRNGYWELPADKAGRHPPALQKAIDGALYYTPEQHTADELMAWWFAREQAKEFGVTAGVKRLQNARGRDRADGFSTL